MTKFFSKILLLSVFAYLLACSQKHKGQHAPAPVAPSGPARAEWPVRLNDLGEIPFGQFVTRDFSVNNTGGEPLHVRDVKITCRCLKADWTREAIPPGGSGWVRVTFEAEKEGEFYRVVPVSTSVDSVGKAIGLIVKGKVLPKPAEGH